ncbi:RNA polymerase sigma-70 factor (TIGR02960 family) [Mycobacterium sp. MAA66]|uniref:RNA polymerase subunit sigma-70 n=1 Tax=Mycobacterium sp. MAA66 TaxID=3156297 RepID=UPI003512EA25
MSALSNAEFVDLTAQYRPELLAHCYRILGSIHDAEDQVQETYLRAWRGFGRFEGRSTVRRWMYTIATRTCLSAVENRGRRPLPSGLGPPAEDHRVPLGDRTPERDWLQPIPDSLVNQQDPATIVTGQAGLRLALIAALQHLPARQRAVLTLRDILVFPAAEVAAMLDTTVDAVDALLRRARRTLDAAGVIPDAVDEPEDEHTRELLRRYVDAFTRADPQALVDLVRADVEFEMPPTPTWFSGSAAVVGFLGNRVLRRAGHWHATPTRANGQPALVFYARADDGALHGYGVQVLTLREGRISRITAFNDPSLVPLFGPLTVQR